MDGYKMDIVFLAISFFYSFFYKYHCLNVTIFYILCNIILQITSGDMLNLVNALEEILSIQTMVLWWLCDYCSRQLILQLLIC
jgi:hypothetical protein